MSQRHGSALSVPRDRDQEDKMMVDAPEPGDAVAATQKGHMATDKSSDDIIRKNQVTGTWRLSCMTT